MANHTIDRMIKLQYRTDKCRTWKDSSLKAHLAARDVIETETAPALAKEFKWVEWRVIEFRV